MKSSKKTKQTSKLGSRRRKYPRAKISYKEIVGGMYTGSKKISDGSFIGKASATVSPLPKSPPKLWPGGLRGKSKSEANEALFKFIREVYGPFFKQHRQEIRSYIFRKDKKLYQSIVNFERTGELPADIALLTVREQLDLRLQRAFKEGAASLTQRERRSVRGKLSRIEKPKPS